MRWEREIETSSTLSKLRFENVILFFQRVYLGKPGNSRAILEFYIFAPRIKRSFYFAYSHKAQNITHSNQHSSRVDIQYLLSLNTFWNLFHVIFSEGSSPNKENKRFVCSRDAFWSSPSRWCRVPTIPRISRNEMLPLLSVSKILKMSRILSSSLTSCQ